MIGEIPEGWANFRIGEVLKLQNGFAFKPSHWSRSGLPIIRIQNLNNEKATFNYCGESIPERFRVKHNDLLFAWSGTPGTSFGAHIWKGTDAWLNQHIFRVDFDSSMFELSYLRHAINRNLQDYIDVAHGGAGLAHITKGRFESSEILVPPFAEQKRIVARLETLQARNRKAREALAELPTLLEQYRQSVLAAAFRGELTAAWREQNPNTKPASVLLQCISTERRNQWEAKYPKKTYLVPERVVDSDVSEVPEGWSWASMQELSWSAGYGTSAKCEHEGKGQPVLRIPNVADGVINTSNIKYSISDLELESEEWLRIGDFLIVRTNGSFDLIGRGAVVEHQPIKETYFASYLIRYRLLGGVDLGRWLCAIWQSTIMRHSLELLAATSAGQYNVSLGKLDSICIPIPPSEEITELVRLLRTAMLKIESLEVTVRQTQTDLSLLENSLLAQVFRGELVEQNPADEPAAAMLTRLKSGTTIPSTAVKQPLRIQEVVHDLILLLRTFNKPMERAALELGLVLMLNDDARIAILDKTATPGRAKASGRSYLEGLDHLLGDLAQAKRWIKITTDVPQMITLTTHAPSTDQADAKARRRAQETLQVMAAVKKERLPAVVEKVCHAAYELVSSS